MMGPMNHPTFVAIFILTKKHNLVTILNILDAWRQINIVRLIQFDQWIIPE